MHPKIPLLLASALLLASSLAQAQQRTTPRAPTPTITATASTPSSTSTVTNSALDAELFYQLLVGELNALNALNGLGGSAGTSYSLMLDAARKTNDAALFQRAVDLAVQARAGEPALQAARAWRTAQPQSREANLQVITILLALNRLPETLEPLRAQILLTPADERNAAIAGLPRMYARASDKKAAAA